MQCSLELQTIDFSHNKIKYIPECISDVMNELDNLMHLYLPNVQ